MMGKRVSRPFGRELAEKAARHGDHCGRAAKFDQSLPHGADAQRKLSLRWRTRGS